MGKKTTIFLLGIIILFGCKKRKLSIAESILNPNYNISFENKMKLVINDTLKISTPKDSPIDYFDSYIYKDSLYFALGVLTNPNSIDVYNIKKNAFVKRITIPKHLLKKSGIRNVYVKSLDSIFLMTSYPPNIYLTNYKGDLKSTFPGEVLDLNIQNEKAPKNQIIYNFDTPITYQKPQIENNKIYALIQPQAINKVEGFRETERIAVFDLKKGKWLKPICKPEGIIVNEGVFYTLDLMSPYSVIVNGKIYVSYPMDHYVFIYDLQGKLLEKKIVSASKNKSMGLPPNLKTLNHRQKSWNFRIQTPFYGPIMYHAKSKVFTRIFYEKQELYMNDGKLNDGSKRKAYVVIFNQNMEKIGETVFKNGTLAMGSFTPLTDGLLIGRMPYHWTSEDELVQKYIYKFIKS